MIGKVLVIAGSDSGSGAGIQADIKTITSLGSFATTAITSLTAQNTTGVQDIFDVPAEFVGKQIDSVLSDIGADVIKIGMLSNNQIIDIVSNKISGKKVVLDPVMIAKGGASLLDENAIEGLITKLVPLSYLVTPNIPEAEGLSGITITNEEDMENAAKAIIELGAEAVLIKGGHMEGDDLIDLLVTENDSIKFESKRIKTNNTHGTGCTTASAISAYLSQGEDLANAVAKAREYVRNAILNAPEVGTGHGPLNHAHGIKAA